MNKIDYLSLNGKGLKTFLVVLEESSISKAAERLGVTQSAVSHTLDKLRIALGDPLFVRAGRNIRATERAIELRQPVRDILDDIKALTEQRLFDPTLGQLEFTVAANDFQRDLIFPALIRSLTAEGVRCHFHFTPSGIPSTELLRQDRCQLLVTPFPPNGPDIFQQRLFTDKLDCFYDASVRKPPASEDEFFDSEFINVRFNETDSSVPTNLPEGRQMTTAISVPNFSAAARFLAGSDLLSVMPARMRHLDYKDFASVPLPYQVEPISMYMVWHRRDHTDPASLWLRKQILGAVTNL